MIARFKKLVGSALGGVTGAGVAAFLAELGVDLPEYLDVLVAVALAALGTYVAPANSDKEEYVDADEMFVDREKDEGNAGAHRVDELPEDLEV